MQQSWRWFGPQDPISLAHIRQAGATGIVFALHNHSASKAWTLDELLPIKGQIEAAGLSWLVCESIPVPGEIKLRSADFRQKIGIFKDNMVAVAATGVKIINYNFMPVVDWTRTDLSFCLPSGALALRFDMIDFIAYDVFILARPNAAADYDDDLVRAAKTRFGEMDKDAEDALEKIIIAGLPGGQSAYCRREILYELSRFKDIDSAILRQNLNAFLKEIIPLAEELGVRLAIHPDDPSFSLFGLPRVVSTPGDLRNIFAAEQSLANGLTLCTGSLGVRHDNDVLQMAREFAPRVHFAHLRNVRREKNGSFYETGHLEGDVAMAKIIFALLDEEKRRTRQGRNDTSIPLRSDHGHLVGDDIEKAETGQKVNPGYSYTGRLKGLGELRGVIAAYQSAV